jgi:hypothetical protein
MLTRYPPGLAAALRKLAADTAPMRATYNATAHLWLKQPSRTPRGEDPLVRDVVLNPPAHPGADPHSGGM